MTDEEAIELAVQLERVKFRAILSDVRTLFARMKETSFTLGADQAIEEIQARIDEEWAIEQEPLEDLVSWLAEVHQESKGACSVCKDLVWPRWYSEAGNFLTDNPHEAKKFKTRDECLHFCGLVGVRHWHLFPTEHVFCSKVQGSSEKR